jgi:hypothetical protein
MNEELNKGMESPPTTAKNQTKMMEIKSFLSQIKKKCN